MRWPRPIRRCASISFYGNATQRFYEFSAKNRDLVVEMAQASLDAILDGRTSRVDRRPPSDADFAQLETALMEQGLGRPEIEALLDGKAPEPPLPDATMCRAGASIWKRCARCRKTHACASMGLRSRFWRGPEGKIAASAPLRYIPTSPIAYAGSFRRVSTRSRHDLRHVS